MSRAKTAKIKVGVYDTIIRLVIVENNEAVAPYGKKVFKKHDDGTETFGVEDGVICAGLAILVESEPLLGYLIYSKDSLSVNTITHETDHMRKYILDYKEVEDHEASANLNAFINQEVFRQIQKWGFQITY